MNKITDVEIHCYDGMYVYVYRQNNHKLYTLNHSVQRLDRLIHTLLDRLPPPRITFGFNDMWLSFKIGA